VLKSQNSDWLYTGQTKNLMQRILQHNSGRSLSTRHKRPYILVHVEMFSSRSDAMKRELFLKSGRGREELKKMGL
jgi:putative endonuclease